MLEHSHDGWLVALSVLAAVIAGYAALGLAQRAAQSRRPEHAARFLLLAATTMGLGIWTMHFIGMLSLKLGIPVSYQPVLMVASLIPAVAGAGVALYVVTREQAGWRSVYLGAAFMGLAVAAMHYIGIASMRMAARIDWNWWLVATSLLIAYLASLLTLALVFRVHAGQRWRGGSLGLAAVAFGVAVAGLHYTGMFAAHFYADPGTATDSGGASTDQLAVVLGAAATLMLVVLLFGAAMDRLRGAFRRDMTVVGEMMRDIVRSEDARASICAAALELTEADCAALLEVRAETGELVVTARRGGSAAEPDIAPAQAALDAGRSMFLAGEGDATARLYEPIALDGRTAGVLFLVWPRSLRRLSERSVTLAGLLAAEASVALERADMLRRLEQQARTDELTGLPNRRTASEELRRRTTGPKSSPFAIAMLDLDHFKSFNDRYGHQGGDQLLRAAAVAWSERLSEGEMVGRYGGEEFLAILGESAEEGAATAADRLRAVVPVGVTCSAGVAVWDGRETVEALIARADAALYEAKSNGRDRTEVARRQEPEPEAAPDGDAADLTPDGRFVTAEGMRAFLDGFPDPFVILNLEGIVDDWNRTAAESLGWVAREARGKDLAGLLGCEALTGMVSDAVRRDDRRWGRLGGMRLTRRSGVTFDADAEWFLFDVGDGDRVGVFLREAVSSRSEAALAAKLEQVTEQFVGAFEASAIGMTLTAPDGQFIAVNPAVCRLLRRSPEELVRCSFQELTHPDDLEKDLVQFRRVFAGEIDSYQMPKRYLLPDGGILWALLTVSVVRGEDGQPLHFVSQVQDIADRMTAEGELQRYAEHLETLSGDDPLTGLGSAGGLMAALSEELTLMRAGGEACTLVTVGVDGGDAATLAAAESMRDVARGGDLAARLGDSELGLLLPGVDAAKAEPILVRLREALGSRAASFGAATATREDDATSLLARARERGVTTMNGDIGAPAQVRALLELLRRQLEMPVSFLARADGDRDLLEHAVGDLGRFGLAEGDELRAADFPCCPGVPVRLRSGELYGTLGAIDSEPCRKLDVRQADLLEFVSELTGRAIDASADVERRRVAETSAIGVRALLVALEARDKYTGEHSREVVGLACRVARRLGLAEREVRDVEQVALLHDVGKVGIPDAILQKQGPLDEVEWEVMRKHPIVGERIIAGIPGLAHLAAAMRGEHERWDGAGYPDGLAGEAIPIASRITLACDAFHAMTSARPYRSAMAAADACEELRRNAGTQFDPAVVAALLAELEGEGVGEQPALSEPARRPGS